MLFKKVYLDSFFRASLEQAAIREGWIKEDSEGMEVSPKIGYRNQLMSRTFLMLTLFDKIDSTHTNYDLSSMVNEGIILENSLMLDEQTRLPDFFEENATRDYAADLAKKLIAESKERFVRHHVAHGAAPYTLSSKHTYQDLIPHFDAALSDFCYYLKQPHLLDFVTDIEGYFACFEECIFHSISERCTFASPLPCIRGQRKPLEIVDDVYYIAKTKLIDEITILPNPTSLADVARMRNAKEMVRFREVLSNWCQTIQEGNARLELRMRSDIRKANQELTKLEKWRKFELSPLNFWLNSVGGHIPIFSNLLTVVNTCASIYSSRVESKHAWVMLGDPLGFEKKKRQREIGASHAT